MIDIPRNPRYQENSDGMGYPDYFPCVVCGKPILYVKARYLVQLSDGGNEIISEEEVTTLGQTGEMGLYPIGADCLRRHPEIKPYVQRWDPGVLRQWKGEAQ